MSDRPVLVLGGRGLLGSHLAAELGGSAGLEVIVHAEERFSCPLDLRQYLDRHLPSVVVNCLSWAGTDPVRHFVVHTGLARSVADWCAARGARAVLISTNAVFAADEERRWLPHDPVAPQTPYEVAKAFGEDPRTLVIRTSFVGQSPKRAGILSALMLGRPYWDRRWNGVTVLTLAEHIRDRILTDDLVPGVAHLHSPEPASVSDIARWVGSTSECLGRRSDARLLGGGPVEEPLQAQIERYLAHAHASAAGVASP